MTKFYASFIAYIKLKLFLRFWFGISSMCCQCSRC